MGHDRRMAKKEDGWSRKVEVDMSTIMVKGKMAERVQKLQLEDEEQHLGSNSIHSMHTIDMVFNNSSSIIVGMNSKKIEKEKLVDCR